MWKARLLVLCMAIGGCATIPPSALRTLDPSHQQAIVVETYPKYPTRANVSLWQHSNGHWQRTYAVPAVVGRNGLAQPGAKKEGDGKTPSGIYNLGPAFGYLPSIKTGLLYRQATADDFWVDDPTSAQYNQWVKGTPQANSFEILRRQDHLYKLALVIDYNSNPVVSGAGSAIFMHIWRRHDHPTAGCVALSERHLRRILRHLNKIDDPVIILEAKHG